MSDLVKRDTDSWVGVVAPVSDLATKIAGTDFVPDALKGKPAAVAAAIMYGRELGLEPMSSLRSINVIKGKPSLSSEAMRAMVMAAGHEITFPEMTNTRCVIRGRRRGSEDTTTVTYSMDDAKRAGLSGNSQYSKMPRQMLTARATAELCRLIFADVIGGLIADVEVDDIITAEVVETPTAATTIKRNVKAPAEPKPRATRKETPADEVEDVIVDDDGVIEAVIVEETEPEVDGITATQLQAVGIFFRQMKIDDREARLVIVSRAIGRPVESSKDLTKDEATQLLLMLEAAKESGDVGAFFEKLGE